MAKKGSIKRSILFGVKGGGSLTGESGAQIAKDIQAICDAISSGGQSKIKFGVDASGIVKAGKQATQSMEEFEQAGVSVSKRAVSQQQAVDIAIKRTMATAAEKHTAEMNDIETELSQYMSASEKKIADIEVERSRSHSAALQRMDDAKAQEVEDRTASKQRINDISEQKARDAAASQERINLKKEEIAQAQYESQLLKNKNDAITEQNRLLSEQESINTTMTDAMALYSKYQSQIASNPALFQSFQTLFADGRSSTTSAAQLKTQFSAIKRSMQEVGITANSLGERIKSAFSSQMISNVLVMQTINAVRTAIRELYNNVVELDEAVVNLSMVTGYNRSETKALLSTYSDLAHQLGSTTTEVAESANEWLRQGYSMEDTNKLIETSMVLSKVGMLDSAEATEYLTAALKGYKIDVEDAMSVVDKMSTIDMMAAVSTGDLAEACSKTANSARLAGVDLDRLYGYIAAVAEVSQADASSVGTSFKTMFARMSNVKLGKMEDEDGNDISKEISDAETVLNNIGIKLRSSKGEFRDFDEVLDDIAAKWDKLSGVEQSTIATAFGGTRQKESILTLFENYDNALKYAGAAADSSGSAMKKFEAYTSGIEAATSRLQATWETLSFDTLDSDVVVFFVNFADAILSGVDALVKMKVVIPAVIAGITAFANVGEQMIESAGLCALRKCA